MDNENNQIVGGPTLSREDLAFYERQKQITHFMTSREMGPCLYDMNAAGGKCISYYYEKTCEGMPTSPADFRSVSSCNIATFIKHPKLFESDTRWDRLEAAGCPNSDSSFFGGDCCKYANGEVHKS